MKRVRIAAAALLAAGLAAGTARAVSDPREMLPDPRQEARAEAIGARLRCLVCQNESIEDSGADLARDLRRAVREQVAAGRGDAQVMAWMVARYGSFIRLRPAFTARTALLWLSGPLALLAGIVAAWLGLRRRRDETAPTPLNDAERARLAALDDAAERGAAPDGPDAAGNRLAPAGGAGR